MHRDPYSSPTNILEPWLMRAVLILLCSASVILFIGQYTDLDLYIADYSIETMRSHPIWGAWER